jgi:S-adenosylmethionine hydrolase
VGATDLNTAALTKPLVSFLSDYGLSDEFVGVCHGVIIGRCPQATIIDITHMIPRQDVRTGALVLRAALPYVPAGVHLAVVDPTVGTGGENARRALALRTVAEDRILVGPDNGLLTPAVLRFGGAAEAVELSGSPERLTPTSRTFHGRDLFAPVAAALAAGAGLGDVGDPCAVEDIRPLALPHAEPRDGGLAVHVMLADSFGNLAIDGSVDELAAIGAGWGSEVAVRCRARTHRARMAEAFAEVEPGELVLYEDSWGMLGLAVNRGSAAELLGVGRDDELLLEAV